MTEGHQYGGITLAPMATETLCFSPTGKLLWTLPAQGWRGDLHSLQPKWMPMNRRGAPVLIN